VPGFGKAPRRTFEAPLRAGVVRHAAVFAGREVEAPVTGSAVELLRAPVPAAHHRSHVPLHDRVRHQTGSVIAIAETPRAPVFNFPRWR
jgi:hypothetical protein